MSENDVPLPLPIFGCKLPAVFMHGINTCFYQLKDEALLILRAFFHENIDIRLVCSGIVHLHSGKQFIYGNAEGIDDTDDGFQM